MVPGAWSLLSFQVPGNAVTISSLCTVPVIDGASVFTGGSLIGSTVMTKVTVAEVSTPPLRVPPSSFKATETVAAPFLLVAGV